VPATFTASAAVGATTVTGTFTVTDDKIDENNESFTVGASTSSLTAVGVTVTITDDDTAGVTLSTNTVSVFDGATETYTVVLDTQPSAQVTVTPTSGSEDKATVSGALVFTSSNWNSVQTVTVTGVAVGASTITHAVTSSSDTNYPTSLSIADVTATVAEAPGVTLGSSTVSVVEGTTATYSVVLDSQPTADVTVTATSGTQAKATVSAALTFTTSDWDTAKTFTVTGVDAGTSEITHAVTSDDSNYPSVTITTVTATINAGPGVTVSGTAANVIVGATATYTVVLDTQPTASVTVTPTSGSEDKATVSGPLVFTSSNWNSAQTVTVTGVAVGTSAITHATDSTGDSDYNNLNPDSVTVTVDNPAQTLSGPVGAPIGDPSPIDTEEEPEEEEPEEDPEEETEEEDPEEETDETETPNEQQPQTPQPAAQQYTIMPRVSACDADNGETSQPFADIDENSYAASDVNCLKELEVTQGTSETTYAPEQPVTRENMASFMSRLFTAVTGDDPPMEEMPFEDVPESSSAANDIASVRALGITEGTSESTYSPEKVVTREQMASFIARLYKAITGEDAPVVETPFTDVSTDSYASDDIGRIYGLGITTGTSDTTYSPEEPVTRAQMASFVARIYRVLTETADDEEPADDPPTDGETEPTDGEPTDAEPPTDDVEPIDDETPTDDGAEPTDPAPTDDDTAPTDDDTMPTDSGPPTDDDTATTGQ